MSPGLAGIGMPESDVDEQIRTFRRKLDRELGIPEGKTFEDWLNQVFRNPTAEQPIELSEFLSHLDIRSFLKGFKPDANVQEMLDMLFKMGDYEHVGAYFRNDAMTRYRENPKKCLAEYHRRNTIEGHNNRIKNETHMEKNIPK